MSDDIRLTMVLQQEAEIAKMLDQLIMRAHRNAEVLDTRTDEEKHRPLPSGHAASRLRYLAYRMRRAREALL